MSLPYQYREEKETDWNLLFFSAAHEGGRVEERKTEDFSLFCFYILTAETVSDVAES